jgi:hypothetical protein
MLVTLETDIMANVTVRKYTFSTYSIVEFKGAFYKMAALNEPAYAVGFNTAGYTYVLVNLDIEAVPAGDVTTAIICRSPKSKLSTLTDGIYVNTETDRRYVVIDGDVFRQNDAGAFKLENRDWNLPMKRLV